jgi:drug/metabolite transporter (DMT)-like permease
MIPFSQKAFGIFLAVSGSLLFALTPAAAGAVYQQGANAVFVIMMTCLMRAGFLTAFCHIQKISMFETKSQTKLTALAGLIQFTSVSCMLGSMMYISGSISTVILFTFPFLLYLWSLLRGQEVFLWSIFVALILGFVGLVLAVGGIDPNHHRLSGLGIGMACVAAIATTARFYIFGREMETRHPIAVGAETFCIVSLLLPLLLVLDRPEMPHTLSGWGFALALGLSASFASFVMFYGISKIGSFQYAFFSKLEPIFAALLSFLILHEILKPSQYLGMILVVVSLIFYHVIKSKKSV